MAARRRRAAPPEEWSCPLCTLLNHWRDRRCAACDQERAVQDDSDGEDDATEPPTAPLPQPSYQSQQAPQRRERDGTDTPTSSNPSNMLRGVFFSSTTTNSTSAATWRSEPRLTMNRRKRSLLSRPAPHTYSTSATSTAATVCSTATNATSTTTSMRSAVATHSPTMQHDRTNAVDEAPSFSLLDCFSGFGALHSTAAVDEMTATSAVDSADHMDASPSSSSLRYELPIVDQRHDWIRAPPLVVETSSAALPTVSNTALTHSSALSDDEDVSQPCFQLLGSNAMQFDAVAPSATPPSTVNALFVTTNTSSDVATTYSNSNDAYNHNNVPPASRQQPQQQPQLSMPSVDVIDMSSPPLRLSLEQHNDRYGAGGLTAHSSSDPVPTGSLEQRFNGASHVDERNTNVDDKLARAGLDLSGSDDENDNRQRQRNKLRRNRIEALDDDEDENNDDEEKAPAASVSTTTWECAICTNFNSAALGRCELCDTKRDSDDGDDDSAMDALDNSRLSQYIDLANSQEEAAARTSSDAPPPNYYGFDPRDFENPYEQVQPDSPGVEDYGGSGVYDDYVDDISDHEAPPMALEQRPTAKRADLQEFEHFVSVEDLRTDYGCRIDYREMFGDPKRGKSYADRIQSRRRASQKRKRAMDGNGGIEPPRATKKTKAAGKRAKGGKARATKKRKATGSAGRASAASGRFSSAAGGPTARGRRASAPVYQGINHYDTSYADLGDGISTMSWEGVGSAGYS